MTSVTLGSVPINSESGPRTETGMGMRILKIVGIGCGSIALLFGLLLGYASYRKGAPETSEVCAHMRELAQAESGSSPIAAAVLALPQSECISSYRQSYRHEDIAHADRLKCSLNAENLAEVEACERFDWNENWLFR